ncbi:serine hydrolase [Granulicella arctica]|uniref:serine hydrolase n=1 Tax=Granulicella arctica TaxID=940613 RepID=UPI0021E09476|nr:serine hydrolase [Granulicella arctica]
MLRNVIFASLLVLTLCAAPALRAQQSPALTPEAKQHIQQVEAGLTPSIILKDDPHPTHTLAERMAALHIPGVSIAVIHHGSIEWAQGFGVTRLDGPPVTPETLFQAGSISKPIAAIAALHLVQQGKLSLDADVNTYLTSWKLPAAPITTGKPVTLRELLTHTGGITVHGFRGYAAGEPVPTLVQVLNGEKPANSAPIRSEAAPGVINNYSGGGYTIMQQMLIDITKEPFPTLLHDVVFAPIGMTYSTDQQPLPADRMANAATPYYTDNKPVPGGPHTYAELAAAGLWTTPSDLARFAMELQTSLQGKSNHVLSTEMTRQMLTPIMTSAGLGLFISGAPTNPYFSHGGVNDGFESMMVAYEQGGDGAVIMTNAQGGSAIADEILHSIAAAYNWPDYHPTVRTAITVDPKILATYTGTFELQPSFSLVVTAEDGKLMVQGTGQPKFPVYAESETKFFPLLFPAEIEFVKDDQGKITNLILHQGGHDMKAMKK